MRSIAVYLFAASIAAACSCSNPAPSATAVPSVKAGESAPAAPVATSGTPDAERAVRSTVIREITLPAGTHLPVVLETTVGSDTSQVEQPVRAHLARPVALRDVTVLPEGSRLSGIVTDVRRPGKLKGRARIAVRFDTLVPAGRDERYQIDTAAVGRTAPSTAKKKALEIGLPAAGGAVIGGLLGGTKGALIGTAAGGGAGTAIVLSSRGRDVRLLRGAPLTLRLVKPVPVRVG